MLQGYIIPVLNKHDFMLTYRLYTSGHVVIYISVRRKRDCRSKLEITTEIIS